MLNKISYRIKEVKALEKKLMKLYEAERNIGAYKLDKPIRHGWYKHLKLREDIARRKDAHVFQNILDVAGVESWGWNKKFADAVWTKENSRELDIQFPGIRKLNKSKFETLESGSKKYFEMRIHTWSEFRGYEMKYHSKVPRYYFVLAYSKAYVTHRKIIDPEIKRSISELESLLQCSEFIRHSFYGFSYHNDWNYPFVHKRARRKVKMLLSNCKDELDLPIWVNSDTAKRY